MRLTLRPNLRSYDLIRRLRALAPPVPSAPALSGGAITQDGPDLILTAPWASGYPVPTVTLMSLLRDAVDVTGDLTGLTLPNFVTGAYVATWFAENSEGDDTITVSGSFTAPAAWALTAGDGLVVISAFPVAVGDWNIVPGAGGANIISFPEF